MSNFLSKLCRCCLFVVGMLCPLCVFAYFEHTVDGLIFASIIVNGREVPNELGCLGFDYEAVANDETPTHVVIPSNVTIGEKDYTITRIKSEAFKAYKYNRPIESVGLPHTIKIIDEQAFNGCSSLSNINLPVGLERIEYGAFANCISLEDVDIPNTVDFIGTYAFSNSGIKHLVMPTSITNDGLQYSAFNDCPKLESVVIPSSAQLTRITHSSFWSCPKLTSVSLSEKITNIEVNVFGRCTALENINLPNSLIEIGDGAFQSCTALKSISIPPSVTTIEAYAFYGCRSLESISISPSVTKIGDYALNGCHSLKSISLPESITSMGEATFGNCDSMKTVECDALVPPSIKSTTFDNYNRQLYVPTIAYDDYARAPGWSRFSKIKRKDAKPIDDKQLPSGEYYITTTRDEYGKYLAVSGSTLTRTNDEKDPADCWLVEALGGNRYNIRNKSTGEYLMAQNCANTSVQPVELYLFSGQAAFGISLENDADSNKFLNAFTYSEYLTSWSYDAGSSWQFVEYDDNSTELKEAMATEVGDRVYDLTGRPIAKPISGGLYIINRKKVIIK